MSHRQTTLVTFLLDRSGSMGQKTIGGFNVYLETLQNDGEATKFTLLQFDSGGIDKPPGETPHPRPRPSASSNLRGRNKGTARGRGGNYGPSSIEIGQSCWALACANRIMKIVPCSSFRNSVRNSF
jgi:hypothetical protein